MLQTTDHEHPLDWCVANNMYFSTGRAIETINCAIQSLKRAKGSPAELMLPADNTEDDTETRTLKPKNR